MVRPPADRVVACADPDCDGLAEPEQDGDVTYHACRECGYEFNYQRVAPPEPTCAQGIPIDALAQYVRPVPQPVLFQIGRRNADSA
jgi:hypothetical protein